MTTRPTLPRSLALALALVGCGSGPQGHVESDMSNTAGPPGHVDIDTAQGPGAEGHGGSAMSERSSGPAVMADATGPKDPVLYAMAPATGAPLALGSAEAWADLAERFDGAINAWDLTDAAEAVAAMPSGSARDVKAGVLAFHRAAYPESESLLAGAVASGQLPPAGALREEAQHYLDLARGAQRALGPATRLVSPDGQVEVVFANAKDELIAPYLFAAMAEARQAFAADLGIEPDHPVRFEILDDAVKLALVSPLTRENVYTTGTVGITKYRRIVMVSPRVMLYGYGWIDTAVHEYVHYLVTLKTRNRAPVWLQEGLAKLLETRWRSPEPLPLEPPARKLLAKALAADDLVTFAEMYPSLAMLPSQERAALAYAQVQTMLGVLREERGGAGIDELLRRVAAGEDAEAALATAWGDTFARFDAHWRELMKKRTAGKPGGALRKLQFLAPEQQAAAEAGEDLSLLGDVFSHLGGGAARQHARLGVLLTLRGHLGAAAKQYEKARAADARVRDDAKLARRLGELYLQLGKAARAVPLLRRAGEDDPEQPNLAAAEGRALRLVGDLAGARLALARALRVNPFIPALHCDLAQVATDPAEQAREQGLCRE
ncbi:peptidase MA family metallohydrolase [Nannocystis bainbridge]|uniref:Peptidase MA-like domain-containing protein n=1 Tax=Nannocystis bainbridge TaxID=2995303 RepID=A0ABT5E1S0_9BACT|nr:hypothetical protein [Nannocystis bainbridge]MDC0719798.1 hypothetical protein [Nannocystis bainbridge]